MAGHVDALSSGLRHRTFAIGEIDLVVDPLHYWLGQLDAFALRDGCVAGPLQYGTVLVDALFARLHRMFDMVPVDRVEGVQPDDLVLCHAVGLAFHVMHHLR